MNEFVLQMCVSHRRLNAITKPFQYPIQRCDDAITFVAVGSNEMWIINLDACQGYHQVAVLPYEQENLAFFAPGNHKYCWEVMIFGPTNAPPFYSATMSDFKYEWDKLFMIKVK